MQKIDRLAHLSEFEALCRERGIPATIQRRAVLGALRDSTDHPTAERIYRTVSGQVRGISQTTVYRVLELLVDMGLARKVCTPGSQCRYDPRIHRHHHLVCTRCEAVVDLDDAELDTIPLPTRRRTGFKLVDYSIQFLGLCPDCFRREGTPRRKTS